MENVLEGYESLDKAEDLLKRAELANTDTEITHLIKVVETSIKELVATNCLKTQNSAIYKVLNNALKVLNSKDKIKLLPSKFSFKPTEKVETPKNLQTVVTIPTPVDNRKLTSNEPTFTYKERCVIKNLKGKRYVRNKQYVDDSPEYLESKELQMKLHPFSQKIWFVNFIMHINVQENCEIILLNTVESAYLSNIRNSIIWIGIAKSSIIIDSISDIVLITSCGQLRISNGTNCRFFVDTVTPPIIESSEGMKFSKNHVGYPNYKEELKKSGLEEGLLESQETIIDFSWHHPEKSPNWEICEQKAGHFVNISNVEEFNEYNTQTITDADWQLINSL
ncbi:conserved hypothetical protein [Theileria equi strain WA]|uniref:C-CAP/cofactor C-like domain-containing protein n=1 Tax=Theileria equi strain WA TaxID=1537102 RepID=L1LGI2_THEEQ|nr:conserved hypothetical protein [Theileria equi strain WA]EKX74384.1 conserved hypothetical protein [Theileria equi strain WA]|eukprot:XP_004833836.1 conserved hypothetical protein [Theileria equi strain WA]